MTSKEVGLFGGELVAVDGSKFKALNIASAISARRIEHVFGTMKSSMDQGYFSCIHGRR
jgi:hypothetical protein